MPIEVTAPPFSVTWSVDPERPHWVRWAKNGPRRHWHDWREFPTAGDAAAAATSNGLCQFIPAKEPRA